MRTKNVPFVLLAFALALAPSAYAGKVELTTYYPSPYGEYTTLKSTKSSNFATDAGEQVGIGTSSPNANAILDVSSSTKAFMPPRMTTAQKNAISSPAAGMTVYDTTAGALFAHNGSTWVKAGGGGCYVSFSGSSCLSGFTNQGSAGTWGFVSYYGSVQYSMFCPPGGTYNNAGYSSSYFTSSGDAYVCCQ